MDAAVQLALMAKAKLVFETEGTFLDFPVLTPLSFHPAQLDFVHAFNDPSVSSALEDFSRAVNCCPSGPTAGSDADDYLWDRYDAWLTAMQLADDQLDPVSQSAYDTARSFLVVRDAQGFETDSPAVVAFKQCRDAVINAEQAYKAAQISATNSGSSDVLADWTNNQAPALQRAIDAANADWVSTGFKAEVAGAQSTVLQSAARLPHTVWGKWRSLYTPDVDGLTNPASNARYLPSGFSPANLPEQAWTTLQMAGPEIAALAANAPPTLRTLFGDIATSSIASISFEFRSAAVVRPWFTSAMFSARFWKFGDGAQLSDGAAPPTGVWPAYICGLVFIRNVQVTQAQSSPRPMPASEFVNFEAHITPSLTARRPLAAPSPPISVRTAALAAARPAVALSATAVKPALAMARPTVAAPIQQVAVVKTAPAVISESRPVSRLGRAVYRLPTPPPPAAPAPAPTTTPATTSAPPTAPTPDDSIAVLAYICKTLPKCPDPDPALSWA